ncbi:endolytic transglycosylase MltG [Ruminococcus sp.]|uniref:endolytic transglycosylase MltG n=1 Tax=Ruminococcus sp. TaxID=41978 RepID=UPI0025EE3AF0|nr:endolytic transglycosylase MltG [Ruminococcus sp.]MBQ8965226.1 endolytic transglycosylase MltG [Ruminococcus sp.]
MSDKNKDIDEILGNDDSFDDISFKADKKEKSSAVDEIDELLASLKKDKPARKAVLDDEDIDIIADEPAPAEEQTEVPVISEADDLIEKAKENAETSKLGSSDDELKKHFGKVEADDDEYEFDEEDEEDELPVKKPAKKNTAPAKKKSSGKKSSGKKKKKKKKGIGFNGSIFGGIILVTIILTVSMLLAVGGLTLGMEFYGIGKSEQDISFNIPEGSTNEEIADLLFENGIIKNKDLFLLAVKVMKPKTIYPGDITLQPSMPYSDMVEVMEKQRERYETVTITFYEGEYLTDIAAKLEENGVCSADDFLFEFKKNMDYKFESYITDNENAFYSREGYCFPDTYEFYVDDNAYNITKVLREHFDSKITDSMYKKMNEMGLTLNETMTLASIVQLEAANVDEMPTVASVFLNRLHDPDTYPMLQTDTTYKYINEVIKKKAGNDDTVAHYTEYYDTYAIEGLPAGPICNPGMDAIKAVLEPAKTKYYYFCNNLETGETFYAETLEEHEKNQILAGLVEAVDNGEEDNGEVEGEGEENYEEENYDNY